MKAAFCHSSLTRDDLWLLEVAKVPQELRDDEAELMQSRWFDYRDLLPSQATYLFADTYVSAYREAYSKARDYRVADEVAPLLVLDIFNSADLLPFWRARQAADRIGCKYDFYLRFVMNRYLERGWGYLPRPNQLDGEEVALDVADAWSELLRCTLQLAVKPDFQPGSYRSLPDQDAYHLYLVEQIKKREHHHMVLSRLVFKNRVLPLDVAMNHFSADVLKRAQFF